MHCPQGDPERQQLDLMEYEGQPPNRPQLTHNVGAGAFHPEPEVRLHYPLQDKQRVVAKIPPGLAEKDPVRFAVRSPSGQGGGFPLQACPSWFVGARKPVEVVLGGGPNSELLT